MQFRYVATQLDGKIIESTIDGRDIADVLQFLISRGLRPVSVKPIEAKDPLFGNLFGRKINLTDKIFLSRYLSLMLKIGTGLLQAINILIEDFDKQAVRNFLIEIRSNLEKGKPFFTTFAKYPKIFSQVYINLIRAGEAAGNLDEIFDNLTNALNKEKILKDQMRSALVYPIILVVAAILIVTFLVMFAIPRIANVFLEAGVDPPGFSKVVFTVGFFFADYGIYMISFAVLVMLGGFYGYRLSLGFRKLVYNFTGSLPIVKKVMKKMAIQRFAATLSSLIKAGIPLTEALEITAEAVGNLELKEALIRISREGLSKGVTVGDAFKREQFFPRTVANLIAISEKAGHTEDVLATLSDFYIAEIDSSLKTLVAFLEPILLLSIGFTIGVIALAIIIPIYQLSTQF